MFSADFLLGFATGAGLAALAGVGVLGPWLRREVRRAVEYDCRPFLDGLRAAAVAPALRRPDTRTMFGE